MKNHCACGSQEIASVCCQPLIEGIRLAETPEQLMRSRYTAFCLKNALYLVDTHHPSTCPKDLASSLLSTFDDTRWCSLRVLSSKVGGQKGAVEFAAFYQASGVEEPRQLRELSHFIKEEGRWYYLDGEHLPPIKLGRNDTCWCGSGKKLKKCHA